VERMGRTSGKRLGKDGGAHARNKKGQAGAGEKEGGSRERRRRLREEQREQRKARRRAKLAVVRRGGAADGGAADGGAGAAAGAVAGVAPGTAKGAAAVGAASADIVAPGRQREAMLAQIRAMQASKAGRKRSRSDSDSSHASGDSGDSDSSDSSGASGPPASSAPRKLHTTSLSSSAAAPALLTREQYMRRLQADRQKRRKGKGEDKGAAEAALGVEELVEQELSENKRLAAKRTRESFARRRQLRRKLARSQLEGQIAKDEERLRAWYPGKEKYLARREELKKRFDPNRLRGAAKPAEEAYPWLYPDYHEAKQKRELAEEAKEQSRGHDYLALFEGKWSRHAQTRRLLAAHWELASVLTDWGGPSNMSRADVLLQRAAAMDGDACAGARVAWMRAVALVDQGELGQARAVVERALSDPREGCPFSAMLRWDLVLIEFISCRVLRETEDEQPLRGAVAAALASNPCVALALLHDHAFEEAVDGDAVDKALAEELSAALSAFCEPDYVACEWDGKGEPEAPREGQPRALATPRWSNYDVAVIYFVRAVSWWRDSDESLPAFLAGLLSEQTVAQLAGGVEQLALSKHTVLEAMFARAWTALCAAGAGEGGNGSGSDSDSDSDSGSEQEGSLDEGEDEPEHRLQLTARVKGVPAPDR
jgi:hypothetical protein